MKFIFIAKFFYYLVFTFRIIKCSCKTIYVITKKRRIFNNRGESIPDDSVKPIGTSEIILFIESSNNILNLES